jgi:hypothetical protein
VQKGAVFGVSQSRDAGAFDVLIALARTDPNPRIRGEAIFWLGQSRDPRAVEFSAEILK